MGTDDIIQDQMILYVKLVIFEYEKPSKHLTEEQQSKDLLALQVIIDINLCVKVFKFVYSDSFLIL